ncbi:MAG: hypothetical protein KAS72_02225 [Phycisphaerales bacterium]|nr:hypothetical protein [Phycisphaerales bacterium]
MDNFELFDMDLGAFGAPGFTLRDRLDLSGHSSGLVDPHINTDLINPNDNVLRGPYRDLSNNQLPGFNGMQNGW